MTEGKVIVVGGGIGGLSTAKQLAKAGVKVTLVSPLEYWDYSISAARCIVEPEAVTKHNFTPPLDKICEFIKCNFVQGSVTEVRADGVTLANGDVLTAGAVVVAIGGSYAGAAIWKARADETSAQARLEGFKAMAAQIEAAQHVVVGGAGLVGVEVAGEIKTKWPSKSVTLVGKMGGMSAKLAAKTSAALKKLGVVLLEDRTVGEASGGTVQLKTAGSVPCDLLLPCAGFEFDAALLKTNFASAVTARGTVLTEPTLLVKGATTVFALGDIVAVPEGCHAPASGFGKCEAHAAVVAANVLSALRSAKLAKTVKWATKPMLTPCMTTLGPKNGFADVGLPSFLEDKLCRSLKCTSFFMKAKMGATFGMGKTW